MRKKNRKYAIINEFNKKHNFWSFLSTFFLYSMYVAVCGWDLFACDCIGSVLLVICRTKCLPYAPVAVVVPPLEIMISSLRKVCACDIIASHCTRNRPWKKWYWRATNRSTRWEVKRPSGDSVGSGRVSWSGLACKRIKKFKSLFSLMQLYGLYKSSDEDLALRIMIDFGILFSLKTFLWHPTDALKAPGSRSNDTLRQWNRMFLGHFRLKLS